MWANLNLKMNNPKLQDLFNDYIPPHKNMGALFLKAFKIQMAETERNTFKLRITYLPVIDG